MSQEVGWEPAETGPGLRLLLTGGPGPRLVLRGPALEPFRGRAAHVSIFPSFSCVQKLRSESEELGSGWAAGRRGLNGSLQAPSDPGQCCGGRSEGRSPLPSELRAPNLSPVGVAPRSVGGAAETLLCAELRRGSPGPLTDAMIH